MMHVKLKSAVFLARFQIIAVSSYYRPCTISTSCARSHIETYLLSFVVYLYVNSSGSITSVGEERADLSVVVYL